MISNEHRRAATVRRHLDYARTTNRLFYLVVLAVSLTGATQGATDWLNWWWPAALAAVAAYELGGVALSVHADQRRQLGERAIPARILSTANAAGAIAVNWFGHRHSIGQAAFFAGMSGVGYCVWLIDSAARRRDALYTAGKLAAPAPIYGIAAWLLHPGRTHRARTIAIGTQQADTIRIESQQAAVEQIRAERREHALAKLLRRKISAGKDRLAAEIAITTYDMRRVAAAVETTADYDGLAAIIAADVTPERVAAIPAPKEAEAVPGPSQPSSPEQRPSNVRAITSGRRRGEPHPVYLIASEEPHLTPEQIAERLGVSTRTVRRHRPKSTRTA